MENSTQNTQHSKNLTANKKQNLQQAIKTTNKTRKEKAKRTKTKFISTTILY